ncbi:Scr1 family TA system antitoxin-like transcriptional regulator [Amycolatopsis sp. NBC_00438]|uniref:Scr1 family TA system antitoxin-like transcriptional regulator n=1 Tax=Amycolatopsis sp. NBC_00438 TaxID=2903558 RepID=UPI002E218470
MRCAKSGLDTTSGREHSPANCACTPSFSGQWKQAAGHNPPTLVAWILGALDIDPASAHRILTHVENASPHLVTDHHTHTHTHTIAAQCYEHIANHTIAWAPIQLPDLLRTSEHDDLLFQHPLVDTDYADHQRQTLLSRRDALITNPDRSHTFLIGDAALLTCPQPARAGQLILLRTLSHHTNITVRIVPINRCSPGLATPFTLYHRDDTAIAVAAHHDHAGTYTSARDILARSADTAAWLTANALDQAETSHALALPDDQPSPVP